MHTEYSITKIYRTRLKIEIIFEDLINLQKIPLFIKLISVQS